MAIVLVKMKITQEKLRSADWYIYTVFLECCIKGINCTVSDSYVRKGAHNDLSALYYYPSDYLMEILLERTNLPKNSKLVVKYVNEKPLNG